MPRAGGWLYDAVSRVDPGACYVHCSLSSISSLLLPISLRKCRRSYSNTTVYYGIHEHSECIPVDSGVTNLIHDRRSCVDFTLEVEANVARCVHSSMNKPRVKRNSGL